MRACADLGGPAAQPLDRTAATLRARAADLAERQVHSAQARLSAMVLTLLPVAALALLLATSTATRTAVLGPSGALCLGAGAALECIRLVVDATDHRPVAMNVVAVAMVMAAIALLAARLAPNHPAARVPAAERTVSIRMHAHDRRRPTRVVVALVAIGALVVVAGLAVAGVIVGASTVGLVRRHRHRAIAHRRAIAAALPDAIEFLVLIVHAGLSPTQAVLEAAQHAPAETRAGFAATAHRLQRGQGLGEALTALVDELGPVARPIADGIAAAERYGLPLAPLLDNLAEQAHAARRRLAEAEARRLPVRLSFPLVACTLPSFALLAVVPAVLGTISSLRGHAA